MPLALFGGCYTAGFQMNAGPRATRTQLVRNASTCIAIPADGRYGDQVYHGSGQTTAEAVNRAFAPYLNTTVLTAAGEAQHQALLDAAEQQCRYLLYSQILHWEDRATEWSGKPDRVALKLSVFQSKTGKTLDSMVFKANSSSFTLGGDHPQDLLYKPLKRYAAELFATPTP